MTSLFSITTELLTHKSEAQFRVAPCEQSRKGRTLTGADFGSFDTQTFLASDYNVVCTTHWGKKAEGFPKIVQKLRQIFSLPYCSSVFIIR